MANPILSVNEFAAEFNVAPSTIYGLAARGEVPSVRFGRAIRFRREAIEKWLLRQEAGNAAQGR
jgi:excisionase family DNA binding protein